MLLKYRDALGTHTHQPALQIRQIIKRVRVAGWCIGWKSHSGAGPIVSLRHLPKRRDLWLRIEQIGRSHCQNLHQLLFPACFGAPPPGR